MCSKVGKFSNVFMCQMYTANMKGDYSVHDGYFNLEVLCKFSFGYHLEDVPNK